MLKTQLKEHNKSINANINLDNLNEIEIILSADRSTCEIINNGKILKPCFEVIANFFDTKVEWRDLKDTKVMGTFEEFKDLFKGGGKIQFPVDKIINKTYFDLSLENKFNTFNTFKEEYGNFIENNKNLKNYFQSNAKHLTHAAIYDGDLTIIPIPIFNNR
jgi:hypothetical protein